MTATLTDSPAEPAAAGGVPRGFGRAVADEERGAVFAFGPRCGVESAAKGAARGFGGLRSPGSTLPRSFSEENSA